MKFLSLAASYRTGGNNQQLVNLAASMAKASGAEIVEISYPDLEAPLFREDDGARPIPDTIKKLESLLFAADGLLLAMPEYNWSFPASLKNLIDWLSVLPTKPLSGKTALLLCATPSKRGGILGLQQLRVPLCVLGVWVHPQVVAIGNVFEALQNGKLQDATEQQYMQEVVDDFVKTTRAMKGKHHAK